MWINRGYIVDKLILCKPTRQFHHGERFGLETDIEPPAFPAIPSQQTLKLLASVSLVSFPIATQ